MNTIKQSHFQKQNEIAFLVDPDKFSASSPFLKYAKKYPPNYFLVGGSNQIPKQKVLETIQILKSIQVAPVILFPGHHTQFSENADGLLLLSMFQSNNPKYIVGELIASAEEILNSSMEIFPTLYLLFEGDIISSTQKMTNVCPLKVEEISFALRMIAASRLLQFPNIYLEGGSGALKTIDIELVRKIREKTNQYILVGGGIRNIAQIKTLYENGADCVVVGNALEESPEWMEEISKLKNIAL